MLKHTLPLFVLVSLFVAGCQTQPTRFELLPAGKTGITFNNQLTESDTLNILSFEYMYNGGGVGVGDFNNDSLTDIFLAGNMVSSKLYLNEGDFKFKDVTDQARVNTKYWCTGISVVDFDQDGWMDVYVCTVNPHDNKSSPNLLFHNKGTDDQGVPVFEEVAAQVGLADRSYSTQAAFFDYDLDGDLDMYLLTNALENYTRNSPIGQHSDGTGKSVDKLFRNNGATNGLPHFEDVSKAAGIQTEGWGLGIVVNDINRDGWPDVYVANDFLSNDHVYINQGNGTFTNELGRLKHSEYNGMGADMGDINNDGLNDILVVDMFPEDNMRQKTMFGGIGYDRFQKNIQMKYQPQYVRNVLQLNNGNGTFSDIGYLSGIYATDWSWSGLIADADNDGWQDIFITNGYRKDITNLDFVTYSKESSMFGTDATRLKKTQEAVNKIEGVKKPDVIFKNNGDLRFTNKSAEWGITQEAYGNGAAYADFDKDGDLDLVINNINDEASVYKNNAREQEPAGSNYLRVVLQGPEGNKQGIGAQVAIAYKGKEQYQGQYREFETQRGYQSTVEPVVHFGLGALKQVDQLYVYWPDGRYQILKDVKANQVLTLAYRDAKTPNSKGSWTIYPPLSALTDSLKDDFPLWPLDESPVGFRNVTASAGLNYKHHEDEYIDYKSTATLPQKYSQAGPGVSVGDVNHDGMDDVLLCGAARQGITVFYQQRNGTFRKDSLAAKPQEDMSMLLFDADGDGNLDLYCVSGSTEFKDATGAYQDRFYRNQGNKFVEDTTAIPRENASGSTVIAADYDRDGDLDLFVGGRIVPGRYPEAPQSFLLQNDGKGKFTDVTPTVAPVLAHAGMITGALWTDFDNDGWMDLAVVGEWMPVSFYKNNQGKSFSKIFEEAPGWWTSITGGDIDGDGDTDYICGNLGLNSLFKASPQEPVSIYAKDFDGNGSFDPLVTRYVQGKEYLTHPRETLTDQIVSLKRKLVRYAIYGGASIQDLLTPEQLQDALVYRATTLTSTYVENLGGGKFKLTALPVTAQFAPLNGVQIADMNADGALDVIGIGNSYASDPLSGYYDAGIGVCLLGDGKGAFRSVPASSSGFAMTGDAKSLVVLSGPARHVPLYVATANRDSLYAFEAINLEVSWLAPGPTDVKAELHWADGKRQDLELYYGSGYLSQSTRMIQINQGITEVWLIDSMGKRRKAWTVTAGL